MSSGHSGFPRDLTLVEILLLVFSVYFIPDLSAGTVHVSPTGDGSDGLEWSTAFTTVSEAIAHSASGDHIWIEQGRYNESIELATGIHLYGGFNGDEGPNDINLRDWEARPTILDATNLNSRVVMGADGTVLDGLFIENGRAESGAGVSCQSATMTLKNCVIRENKNIQDIVGSLSFAVAVGGGIFLQDSHLVIDSCRISGNQAKAIFTIDTDWTRGSSYSYGGGIYCLASNLIIRDSQIDNNMSHPQLKARSSSQGEMAVVSLGGGVYVGWNSQVEVARSRILGNQSNAPRPRSVQVAISGISKGGGFYCTTESSLVCRECLISDNSAFGSGDYAPEGDGGGVYLDTGATAIFTNSLFIGNHANELSYIDGSKSEGGGIYTNAGTNVVLGNCTIADNHLQGIYSEGGLTCSNSIIWNGTHGVTFLNPDAVSIKYSDVQGGYPGEGVIDADPLFENEQGNDYRLTASSPCIDTASTTGPINDVENMDRPFDVPGVGRDGTGDEFDMGAYEETLDMNPTWTPTRTPTLAPTRTPTNTPTFSPTPTFTPSPNFQTHFVDGSISESGDGSGWSTAFMSISEALINSVSGDQIWVKEGIYREAVTMRNGVDLYGGFVGSEVELEVPERDWADRKTILTIDYAHLVIGAIDCTLDGFTLSKGITGIFCENSNMRIVNCLVKGSAGQGLYASHSFIWMEGVKVFECRDWVGDVVKTYGQFYVKGGGIHGTDESQIVAKDCQFRGNSTSAAAGIFFHPTDDMIALGGAIMMEERSNLSLFNCEVTNNVAQGFGYNWLGVADGGGVYLDGGVHRIENSTIAGNRVIATDYAMNDQISINDATVTIINSIIWNDGTGTEIAEGVDIRHSAIDGGYSGEGNIDSDPMFWVLDWDLSSLSFNRQFEPGDYRLLPGSPCIDSASTMGLSHDLLGNPRPIDVPGVGRDGTDDEYDMGAYEATVGGFPTLTPTPTATPTATPTMPFDECVDGRIDGCDLITLIETMMNESDLDSTTLFDFAHSWGKTQLE